VLPFRAQGEPRSPVLSPVERKTFSDLAQQLSARLKSADAVLESEASGPDGAPPARAPADESAADDASMPAWAAAGSEGRALLDRLPIGLLVYRLDTLLYANRAFLERTGHPTVESFQDAGGLEALFIETGSPDTGVGQSLTITTSKGETTPTEGRLLSLQWNGENALALMLLAPQVAPPASAPATAPPNALTREVGELKEQLQRMQVRLTEAGQQSQPSAARAELLARIGVDMRTPLNTVVGLVETMLEEKFGPIGNERYRGYLSDIGKSGDRIAALVGDIDDLAKAGDDKLGEGFITLNLNDIVQSCVSAAQPQASVARVLVRNSLAPELPTIRADAAILRQVVQNLLANSIKLAGKGGQVIVSTAPATERVVLRLRDTGPGMTETELAAALQPARSPVAAPDAAAALTLAVTKTLAEANNAQFIVISKPGEGTLIEISFPQRPPAA
jgi:signal transduction histidine kinase